MTRSRQHLIIAIFLLAFHLPLHAAERLVCLGDSITDGYTYGQILTQTWQAADRRPPAVICAGVASDTAPLMADRLDATVLRFRPDLVTFSAGTNDALRGVTPEQYEAALRSIAAGVKQSGASMVLLTPCLILRKAGKTPEEEAAHAAKVTATLDAFEAIIRAVAAEYAWPVAENRARMQAAVDAGQSIMAGDGIHPNYLGQSLMARAILDALGDTELPLPTVFAPPVFPGILPAWQLRLAPMADPKRPELLTAETVQALTPDATWKTLTLPIPVAADAPSPEDWKQQIIANGFATGLTALLGKGRIQAVATVNGGAAPEGRTAWLNLGGGIATVWLNGVQVHDQGTAWTGYHAGKERLEVHLNPGPNRLVIEVTGGEFFLSVTDELVWENALR